MKVEESILIDRSPQDVFAFFDERANDRRWMASIIESEWLDEAAPTGLGRRGRMLMEAMGKREFADEVTRYEPGRLVAHRSESGPMVIHTACIVRPVGGVSRVTVSYEAESLPGGIIGRILEPLTSRIVRRNYRADLRRLKALLETKAAADPQQSPGERRLASAPPGI
jgi:uncharacterized membrane protein